MIFFFRVRLRPLTSADPDRVIHLRDEDLAVAEFPVCAVFAVPGPQRLRYPRDDYFVLVLE
jgi:hypothetical protein